MVTFVVKVPLVPVSTDPYNQFILTKYILLTPKTDKGGEPVGPFDNQRFHSGKEFKYLRTFSVHDGTNNTWSRFSQQK